MDWNTYLCLYLFYLGINLLIAKREKETEQKPHIKPASLRRIYTGGVLTNVLNPKVALFFLAFVPQFIPADVVNKTQAFITLGGVFVFTGTLWCIFLALATAFMRNKLGGVKGLGFWLNKAAGGLFVYFGVKLGLASAWIKPAAYKRHFLGLTALCRIGITKVCFVNRMILRFGMKFYNV